MYTPWSTKHSLAILAVSDITPSDFGHEILKRVEDGTISYAQAKQEILRRSWNLRDKQLRHETGH